MPVPNSFANVTTSIPLSQLDANFNTPITLGNTAIQLGNTVTTLNNMTLANVTISTGNVTLTNATVTTANVTTANIATEIVTTSQTLNYGTANGVVYLNASKVSTSGANLVFDGTNMGLGVTPSAWASSTKVFQTVGGSVIGLSTSWFGLGANYYYDGTNNRYVTSNPASLFVQDAGVFKWFTAPSGTAGNTASLTQILAVEGGKSLALEGATSQSGTGITFPATQSASSNANTLDDYEEGTFTPTLNSGFSVAPTSYTTQLGRYTKVGRMVYFEIDINPNGATANATQIRFSGLPFTSAAPPYGGAFVIFQESFNTNAGDVYIVADTTTRLDINTNTGLPRNGNAAGVDINNRFIVSGVYTTT
jgi:hypothetical protein